MARPVFLFALLAGAATSALAGTSASKDRDARNAEIVFSQYPPRALAAGEQGAVGFNVTLDRDGYASGCEVTHSSGYPRLDSETCQLILNRAEFKGVRGPDGRKTNTVTQGVVNWRLPAGVATAGAAPVRIAAAKPEKKICRRRVKTGSLADYERLCATQADWDRMAQRTKEEWGAVQGAFGSTKGN
ncbi:MAG: periplasmic protein TonB [Sphingomonadales bacterium]|jgi:TonB family protein|nr:periplasmic protein TonB [Sphingomonadales bacterium]